MEPIGNLGIAIDSKRLQGKSQVKEKLSQQRFAQRMPD
jgi:hypothetical protein